MLDASAEMRFKFPEIDKMAKTNHGGEADRQGRVEKRGHARAHAPSTPPRTNASKPVRRARLSADPKLERNAWLEIESLLTASHRRLEQQFVRAAKLNAKDADGLAQAYERLADALRRHFDVKVGIVYPTLYESLADAAVITEAEIEIDIARELLARLGIMKPFDEMYQPTINILSAWIDRHLDQERVRLFAAARRAHPAFVRKIAEIRARFADDAAIAAEAQQAAQAKASTIEPARRPSKRTTKVARVAAPTPATRVNRLSRSAGNSHQVAHR